MLRKLNYPTFRGEVFKMVAKSKFTFQYPCIKHFCTTWLGNEAFRDRLVRHMQRILPILSKPESSPISQLKMNKDLIEMQRGWFWSFPSALPPNRRLGKLNKLFHNTDNLIVLAYLSFLLQTWKILKEKCLRGSLPKSGPLDFATKNTFPLFFVGEEALAGIY